MVGLNRTWPDLDSKFFGNVFAFILLAFILEENMPITKSFVEERRGVFLRTDRVSEAKK